MREAINNNEILPAIKNLFSGVIPEVSDSFFKKYKYIPFAFLEDDKGIVFRWNTKNEVIEFSAKSLRVVWLFTVAIWQVYNAEARDCLEKNNIYNNREFINDCYSSAMKFMEADSEDQFEWPTEVLNPYDVVLGNKNLNEEEIACYKLACFSLSFIFLHEYNHAIKKHSAITGCYAINEELESDQFAINTLIDDIKEYSKQTGEDITKIYLLRFLGIFFSLIFLYKHEQYYGNNEASHPLVKKRMEQIINKMLGVKKEGNYIFEDNDKIFCVLFLILKSEVDLNNLSLGKDMTAKDIVIETIKNL